MQSNRPSSGGGSGGGSGGYPSTITTASLSSNFTISANFADEAGAGSTAVTGLSCTITTTRTNEIVHLEYLAELVENVSASALTLGYQIDSATPVALLYYNSAGSRTSPVSISQFIQITGAPGSYTVKITACKAAGAPVLARRAGEGTSTDLILMKVTQF